MTPVKKGTKLQQARGTTEGHRVFRLEVIATNGTRTLLERECIFLFPLLNLTSSGMRRDEKSAPSAPPLTNTFGI